MIVWPRLPILEWLPRYDWRRTLPYDAVAGITVGCMAIPQSMSYALIAGLPPQYGLYGDLQIIKIIPERRSAAPLFASPSPNERPSNELPARPSEMPRENEVRNV